MPGLYCYKWSEGIGTHLDREYLFLHIKRLTFLTFSSLEPTFLIWGAHYVVKKGLKCTK